LPEFVERVTAPTRTEQVSNGPLAKAHWESAAHVDRGCG